MFKTNEYFDGKVKSIAFNSEKGPATLGVMAAGEYEFGTSTKEYMTVISGVMEVMLPGSESWKSFNGQETFIVEKDLKFKVRTKTDVSYLCVYE